MSAEVQVKKQLTLNPCCALWKEKCVKLEEGRKCLRQAVKLLTEQADKLQAENVTLKKVLEEEKARAKAEKEAKEKEAASRVLLENEISALKSEILSLQQKGSSDEENQKGEVKLLQTRVSKGEKEISQLKELLEKEKVRAGSEKKNAEAEKKSAAEAWKCVEAEKAKAGEEMKHANIEAKKAEEYRIQLEALKKEADLAKAKMASETLKFGEANKKFEAEKHMVTKEKKCADSEMTKTEVQRKIAEANAKAEEYRIQLEALEKEADLRKSKLTSETLLFEEANRKYEAEKHKVAKEKKRADSEVAKAEEQRKLAEANGKKFMEERSRAENLSLQLEDARRRIEELQKAEKYQLKVEVLKKEAAETRSKLISHNLKLENMNKMLEAEKEKVTKEGKRADLEMVKAEKQRALAEMNGKMAVEVKDHAEQLSQQLEVDKIKIKKLQEQIQELLSQKAPSASAILPDKVVDAEATKLKLLETQLKLEKMRLKRVKEAAKLEKSRNSVLQQELARLKLDFGQISFRLDVLDKCFSSSAEGTEGMEKVGDIATMQRSRLKRKFCVEEPLQMDPKNESELHCTAPLVPFSGGNFAASISGIDSKLESLLGGSNQKMLQSSAINSSSASFSDGQLVGSQGRGAVVTTSENLIEVNFNGQPTISSTTSELTKLQNNKNLAVVAENSVRSPNSIGRINGHSRKKRRRMLDTIESVELLFSEGKKLNLQLEKKLSALHGMFDRQIDKPLEIPKHVEASSQGDSYAKREMIQKKGNVSHEENATMHLLTDIGDAEKTKEIGKEVLGDVNAGACTSPPVCNLVGDPQACGEVLSDSFEEVANGDYMKLLDLDNPADEECFRRAMEMPMSPTLPEIEFSGAEISDMDMFRSSVGQSSFAALSNGKESLVPSLSLDVVDVEISANQLKTSALETYRNHLLPENEGPADSLDILDNRNGACNTMDGEKASDGWSWNSGLEIEMLNRPWCGVENLKVPCESELGSINDNIPTCCVMLSNTNDAGSMSRIFFATRNCMVRCSLDTQTVCMVQKIFHALQMEDKILPRERVCTLFTLLLLNFSACAWGKCGSVLDQDFLICSDSFASDINKVLSNVEMRSSFTEICCLDELLGIIEEFLMDRKVMMVHTDLSPKPFNGRDSAIDIVLDGVNINFSSKSASADQLVAASVILGSICARIDHVGFLCEASYNLLRMRRCDSGHVLAILHVFAYLAGEKYFSLKKYSLTMTVLKSIVIFLEGGNLSVASAATCFSMDDGRMFHPHSECPFSVDAVSMDCITAVLLEKLHSYAVSGIKHHMMESANVSNFSVLCSKGTPSQSLSHEVHSSVNINCDASCGLIKCTMPGQSNSSINETLCDLSDLLSLLELIASNMSWEWTCDKIIPKLLEMFERTNLDNFSIAVVILLGQLGRLGVATHGYEDKGVENLRCKLSDFLSQHTTSRPAFLVQIATTTALLGLLSLDFEEVIPSNSHLPAITSQSVFTNHIRQWYSSLGKDQQALSYSLLQSSGSYEMR